MASATTSSSTVKKVAVLGVLGGLFANKVLIISILAHLIFGAGATYYVVQRIATKRKMTFQGGPPVTNPSKRALEHKVALGKKKAMMSAPAQAKRIMTTGLSKVALPDLPTLATATDAIPNKMAGMGGVGQGFGSGGGGGGMGGGGGGAGINFFGLRSEVKRVVFVVDVSGSMVTGEKTAATYKVLEKEVRKVINGLDPRARFGLVAFSGGAIPYRDDLSSASPEDKRRAIEWLKDQNPDIVLDPKASESAKNRHHGTRADLGLERAFLMKPDTIFFVSDGQPTGVTVPEVMKSVADAQKAAGRPVKIHVIAYVPDSGQPFMQALAKTNGGTYREIKLEDVPK